MCHRTRAWNRLSFVELPPNQGTETLARRSRAAKRESESEAAPEGSRNRQARGGNPARRRGMSGQGALEAQVAERLKAGRERSFAEERQAAAKFSLDLHHKDQLLEEPPSLPPNARSNLKRRKGQAEALKKSRELDVPGASLTLHRERVGEATGFRARQGRGQLAMHQGARRADDPPMQAIELKRKSEQGSQQLQGECGVAAQALLRSAFRTTR
jgi:hypothetical protein